VLKIETLDYVVKCIFIFFIYSVYYIVYNAKKNADKVYTIICIPIHSGCYVLNFLLPAQQKRLGRPGRTIVCAEHYNFFPDFLFHHRVQNGCGAHPASYPMGTRGSFPGGKAAGE
jgi:hypothetical protein